MHPSRSLIVIRSVLVGFGASAIITFVSALLGFPLAFSLLPLLPQSLGLVGPVLAFALTPILANVFVWRAYMSRSGRATQASLLVTGFVLSLLIGILFLAVLIFGMLSDA